MIYDLAQPEIQPVPGADRTYRLMRDYLVQLPYSGRWLLVKEGFIFDGASIPRWLWSVIGQPFDPNWCGAALIHDALYAGELLSRRACDKELFHAMRRTSKIGHAKARKFFIAVDTFGGCTWRRHTAKSVLDARTECGLFYDKPEGWEPWITGKLATI